MGVGYFQPVPSDKFRVLMGESHEVAQRRKILAARRRLGLSVTETVPISPPDSPITCEADYLLVLARLERFVRRNNDEAWDLNGVPYGERRATMAEALKAWNASLPPEVLGPYEAEIQAIKKVLRSPWPPGFSQEHADKQRRLRWLKERVTPVYRDRHEVRQAKRHRLIASSDA